MRWLPKTSLGTAAGFFQRLVENLKLLELTKPEKTVGMVNKQSKSLRTGAGKTQGHVSATKSCVYLL